MAEKLALSSSFEPTTASEVLLFQPDSPQNTAISPSPPMSPRLHDLLPPQTSNSQQPIVPKSLIPPFFISRNRTRIGKARDSNRGKPWSHHRLSTQGQRILQLLVDPSFDVSELNDVLLQLFEHHREEVIVKGGGMDCLTADVLGIIKGLGFN
ncbi:pentatricopeptide repeat-containing protein [Tripterygium wilfordii]|uniref:Pentatricopeptide repeat-containing protein n=1 Tax=Tripterygium wilfordii TaxID=458696 RepID=A0A7J7CCM2_TRIWF|nr:pentatricopeptide repeat-containing protein [Tripterygium wilfordii]